MGKGIKNPYVKTPDIGITPIAVEGDSITLDGESYQITLNQALITDVPARLGLLFNDLVQKHKSILLRNGIGFFRTDQQQPTGDIERSRLVTPSGSLYVFVSSGDTETEIFKRLGHTLVQANDADLLKSHKITLKIL